MATKTLRSRVTGAIARYLSIWPAIRRVRGGLYTQRIPVEYRVDPQPRYGYGKPPHAQLKQLIGQDRQAYRDMLESFLRFEGQLLAIPVGEPDEESSDPFWNNTWFAGLDLVALYSLLTLRRPRCYFEIGSGHSTRVARRAIADQSLPTRILSLDPRPRAAVDALCDDVVRARLEDCDPALFERLAPGDMLFFDGSHRCFQNSDVAVFFLDVLPRLPSGVLVHVHDIWLPNDYPPEWGKRYYSEQYLLGVYLLARDREKLRIVLPNSFVSEDGELRQVLYPLWNRPQLAGVNRYGVSFWFES